MSSYPKAIGPYSVYRRDNGLLFVSGQLPIDPKTGSFAGNDISIQTKQSLENIKAILAENNISFNEVVKTTVLLSSMNDFDEMNKVYGEFFNPPYPARSTFEVSRLPKDALVEIEIIAKI